MRPQQHITDDSDEMYKIYRRRKVRINLLLQSVCNVPTQPATGTLSTLYTVQYTQARERKTFQGYRQLQYISIMNNNVILN